MKCKQCGTDNAFDARICSNCGYVFLDEDDAMFSSNEQTINAEASHKQSQIDEIKKRRDMKRKRKKIRKIALILLIIILCGGAIYGAFYLSEQNDIKFSENTVQPATQTPTVMPTETPVSTPEPTVMPTPSETSTPVPTETIAPTEEPAITVQTQTPSEAPVVTAKPKSNKTPAQKVQTTQKATPKPTIKPTPTPNPELKSAVALAGETITDSSGKMYSTIVTSGKIFYIEVSSPLENNSYSVVSGTDTGKKINNLPVYATSSLSAVSRSEFILPDSSVRLLTQDDLKGLNTDQLKIARNEIYARNGRKFTEAALNAYFSSKSWYKVNSAYKYNNDALNISDIENKNAHMLLAAEQALYNQQNPAITQ